MPAAPEIIGIDHIYFAVSSLPRSERYHDAVTAALGFRKYGFDIDGGRRGRYYNRHFGSVLRPARARRVHNPYAPDHLSCFFSDPDGIRLEITNYRSERRQHHDRWSET